jgi:hypothetical protein
MATNHLTKKGEMVMKKLIGGMAVTLLLCLAGVLVAAESAKMELKVGDEVYVCSCPASCPCDTMSRKQAKCGCNKDMVKAKVTKLEGGKAFFMVNGEEKSYTTTGKYACGCGEGCGCGTISQSKGNCACGKPLVKVN